MNKTNNRTTKNSMINKNAMAKIKRIISVMLILSVFVSNIFTVGATKINKMNSEILSADPLMYMIDDVPEDFQKHEKEFREIEQIKELLKYMDQPEQKSQKSIQADIYVDYEPELLHEIEHEIERFELELRESIQNNGSTDGSTDRYIVKYKPERKQNFESKLTASILRSDKISVSVDSALSAEIQNHESTDGRANLSDIKRKDEVKLIVADNNWELLTLNEKVLPSEFAEVIRTSQAHEDIEYIQPDYKLSLDSFDVDYDEDVEDEFENNSNETPDEFTGELEDSTKIITDKTLPIISEYVTVAVIDTGADISHRDLVGCTDVENAWNFAENNNEVYSSSNPLEYAHGTHIAGIIANTARENGIGNIKILPLRVFSNGEAYTSDIIAAIEYAVLQGATIINCSFGSTQENPVLEEVMSTANALFVCAVGNNRRDFVEKPSYPAGYELPNIISVAAVNADGGLSYFSNYGKNIDITALGRDVVSALPENANGKMTGTSMSAAYVTAVAAVVNAQNMFISSGELKYRLLNTSDMLSNLQDKVNQGKRVNLANAVDNITQLDIIQNKPEDDFDANGYQTTESEVFELYSSGSITQNITANVEFTNIYSLANITSFNEAVFTLSYNPAHIELVDFAAQTYERNVNVGVVPETDLQILSHNISMGDLIFKVNKTLEASRIWSGVMTMLKFKAKTNGTTTLVVSNARRGDLNDDGVVDMTDANLLLQYAVGGASDGINNPILTDLDYDGVVGLLDLRIIVNLANGIV